MGFLGFRVHRVWGLGFIDFLVLRFSVCMVERV